MAAQKRVDDFIGRLVTVSTPTPYDTVRTRLFDSIARNGPVRPSQASGSGSGSGSGGESPAFADKAAFARLFDEHAGPHGFTHFTSFNHGAWIGLFGIGAGARLERVVLGNGLLAKTLLEHDLNAALFAPLGLLLEEVIAVCGGGDGDGDADAGEAGAKAGTKAGTEVIYVVPSSLITGVNKDEKLVAAAGRLDENMDVLVRDITA